VSVEENKEIVRRVIEEATNRKNFAVFDELISPSFVDHEAGPEPGGSEGEKKLLSAVAEAFPDWRWDVEDMIAEGDKVSTRCVARGTHRGEFMARPRPARRSHSPASTSYASKGARSWRAGAPATS
jgi:predicted ester cyclase